MTQYLWLIVPLGLIALIIKALIDVNTTDYHADFHYLQTFIDDDYYTPDQAIILKKFNYEIHPCQYGPGYHPHPCSCPPQT